MCNDACCNYRIEEWPLGINESDLFRPCHSLASLTLRKAAFFLQAAANLYGVEQDSAGLHAPPDHRWS